MSILDDFISGISGLFDRKDDEDRKQLSSARSDRTPIFNEEEFSAPSATMRPRQNESFDAPIDKVNNTFSSVKDAFMDGLLSLGRGVNDTLEAGYDKVQRDFEQSGRAFSQFGNNTGISRFVNDQLDRDLFGDLPGQDNPLSPSYRDIGNVGNDLVENFRTFFPRAVASTGLEIGNILNPNSSMDSITPSNDIQKFILGDEPVRSISKNAEKLAQEEQSYGIPKGIAQTSALPLVALSTGLDLFPFGSGAKKTGEEVLERAGKTYGDDVLRFIGKSAEEMKQTFNKFAEADTLGEAENQFFNTVSQDLMNGKTYEEIFDSLSKSASSAVESLRTPLKTTSIGGTDTPDSVRATTLPSTTDTVTTSPSYKYTPSTSVKDILSDDSFISKYNDTIKEEPYLKSLLEDVAGDNAFKTNIKKQETAAEKIVRKIPTKPSYDETQIGDILRGNIIAKDEEDALNTLRSLSDKVELSSIDNYIEKPNNWGYHGININIRTPNGNLAEVQIHTPKSIDIQKNLHPLYEKWRNETEVPVEVFQEAKKIVDQVSAKYKPVLEELGDLPPIAPEVKTAAKEIPKGMEELKFVETVRESPTSKPPLAEGVEGFYKVRGNPETLELAKARVRANLDDAIQFAKQKDVQSVDEVEQAATQQVLMMKFQNEGNYEAAIDMADAAAELAKNRGQAIQALSMWGRLTPDGILRYAKRIVNKANEARPEGKKINISEKQAKEIIEKAKKLQEIPEGTKEKAVETAALLQDIGGLVPPSLAQRLSAFQTIAQLLNPKTATRNIIGNLGFSALENIKDIAATPIDMATGLITGERTKTLPSIRQQLKSGAEGFKEGFTEAMRGVDTANLNTQMDLPKGSPFKGTLLEPAEKALSVILKAPDRAFYKAARDESLRQQMKAAGVATPTNNMLERAHYDGLYRTFQDDSIAAEMFGRLKKAFNTGQFKGEFGFGDLVLKYPKTPGNLLARAVEYSPAGFVNTVTELAMPLFGEKFDQKTFVESTARALTGSTLLFGTGAILHRMGIISGANKEEDPDIGALNRENEGLSGYKINVSALKRLVMSGFNPDEAKPKEGDTMISYDWFQPQAVGLALGADFDAHKANTQSILGRLADGIVAGSGTIAEQPLVQGVESLFKYGDISKGVQTVLGSLPSSFVPTLINQVRQMVDNTSRNTTDSDFFKENFVNKPMSKIPFLSDKLPARVGVFGEELENYQNDSNNLFNVFLNPAFVSKLETSPEGKEVLDLYNSTGESSQAPRVVPRSIKINGETKKLTGEEQAKMQKFVGRLTKEKYAELLDNPRFQKLDDEEKVQQMTNILTAIHSAAKYAILGNKSKRKPSRDVRRILKDEGFGNIPLIAR